MLDFEYRVMDFTRNPTRKSPAAGDAPRPAAGWRSRRRFARFSSDYVLQETKRAVAGVAGSRTQIWPGLGIDVQDKNSTPESVRAAVHAAFQGGATGLVISTSHAALRPENLSAAGAALRELKLA